MQQTKVKESEMLEQLYKNAKMGSDSIIKLLSKVSDGDFKMEMTKQLDGYEKLAARSKERLSHMGCDAKEENSMTKFWASIGMTMNTLADSSESHLAQMITEGSTMGVTDSIRILREYENTDVSESALSIVKDMIKFEEGNVENMKKHI